MDITRTKTERASVWANHMDIKSETSSRMYTVAQCISGKNAGTWGCNCPGFKAHKKVNPLTGRVTCKHLDNMGLLGPFPSDAPAKKAVAADTRHSFSDEAYRHYDTSEGFGSPDEWAEQAEQWAYGKGRYRGGTGQRSGRSADMRLLGLDRMPEHVDGLKDAMRRMAREKGMPVPPRRPPKRHIQITEVKPEPPALPSGE